MVGYVVDLIVLWDYFTARGVLSYLMISIGAQAQIIYNIIVTGMLGLAFCVPFYFGYRFSSWRLRLKGQFTTTKTLERFRALINEEPKVAQPLAPEQFRYRGQVRTDLLRIIEELYVVSSPKRISFPSWNETTDHDLKRQNIGNKRDYDVIEVFSTCLNQRNNYVNDRIIRGVEDAEFRRLNNECIMNWEMVGIFLYQDEPARKETEIPKITVARADIDSARLKEFQVQLKDGVEPFPAQFYCVTVRNLSGPTVRELEGHFEASFSPPDYKTPRASVDNGPLLFILSSRADHLTIYEGTETRAQFRKAEQRGADLLRITLLGNQNGKPASRQLTLHQGDKGKTFALFFTMKGYEVLTIAGWSTRANVEMPCRFKLDLYLSGDTLPERRVASFLVEATKWDALHVELLPNAGGL